VHKGLCEAVSLRPSAVKLTIPIEHVDHTFDEDVRAILPENAKHDICQAGRCLAFDYPLLLDSTLHVQLKVYFLGI